jgi:hypothetical protein
MLTIDSLKKKEQQAEKKICDYLYEIFSYVR